MCGSLPTQRGVLERASQKPAFFTTWNFQINLEGGRVQTKKPLCRWGMDIFWNNTINSGL